MDEITKLARFSVLRASGYAGIAILLVMLTLAFDPLASFLYGALGLAVLAVAMTTYARFYHVRRRINETEVWIMLPKDLRPEITIARSLIVNAMRDQLNEKSDWWANLSRLFLGIAVAISLTRFAAV
ncbi:hypothetical protein [Pelagibacterium limicola]|uniref:hypothetical protein n=1 Tax=Pelagibacterium limicola TaxID=2791022 RepID=UPI0018AFBA4D|nr:hypothetical protein [Pelagibacterium limicola]